MIILQIKEETTLIYHKKSRKYLLKTKTVAE